MAVRAIIPAPSSVFPQLRISPKKSIKSLEKSITPYYSRVYARENLHIRNLFINFAPIFGILQTQNIRTILIKRIFY